MGTATAPVVRVAPSTGPATEWDQDVLVILIAVGGALITINCLEVSVHHLPRCTPRCSSSVCPLPQQCHDCRQLWLLSLALLHAHERSSHHILIQHAFIERLCLSRDRMGCAAATNPQRAVTQCSEGWFPAFAFWCRLRIALHLAAMPSGACGLGAGHCRQKTAGRARGIFLRARLDVADIPFTHPIGQEGAI